MPMSFPNRAKSKLTQYKLMSFDIRMYIHNVVPGFVAGLLEILFMEIDNLSVGNTCTSHLSI